MSRLLFPANSQNSDKSQFLKYGIKCTCSAHIFDLSIDGYCF